MRPFLSFLLILICYSLSAQSRVDFYFKLEGLIDTDQLEEVVKLENDITKNAVVIDSLSSDMYSILGETYLMLGELDKSAKNFQKAYEIRKQLNPVISEGYSNVLYNLVAVYMEQGLFPKAIITANELLSVDEELYGKKSVPYLETILYYSNVLVETGKYSEALKMLNSQLKYNYNPFLKAILITKKGDVLSLLGNYESSTQLISEASGTFAELEDTLNYSLAQSALGLNYISQGKYPQAEQVFINAKENLTQLEESEYFIDGVNNNLALAQMALGRSANALIIYKNLLKSDSINFGITHPNYITSLINIGTAYNDLKDFSNAEKSLKEAQGLAIEVYGSNSNKEGTILNNLGNVLRDKGEYQNAIEVYTKALKVFESTEGKSSARYANVIFNTGKTEVMMKSKNAERTLLKALKLRKKILGESHPKYSEVTNYLGIYYWQQNDLQKARKYFEDTFINYFEQIKQFFPALSEEEKTKFYLEKIRPAFEQYNSIAVQLMKSDPSILKSVYDYQLRTKGIIMVATERLRRNIYDSKDTILIQNYEEWKLLKERLSKLYSNNDSRVGLIDSLNEHANEIERKLVTGSSDFARTYDQSIPTWEQIKNKLADDEVAVEIIRYRVADPEIGGAFTEEVNYLALVIDNKSESPRAVHLTRGNLMEGRYLNNYRNSIRYQIMDDYTYNELWKPLEKQFKGAKKIYISPDGVYNQVNLSTLVNPETGEYLIKEIEIQEVTSTRDLLSNRKGDSSSSLNNYLFGFPTYTIKDSNALAVNQERSLRGGGGFSETRGLRGGLLRYMRSGEGIATLPGTKTEIEEISQILNNQGVKTMDLLTKDANESALKRVSNPKILHIATHGYFLENVESPDFDNPKPYYQNPLLRAGLIMAGAEDFLLTGSNTVDSEDGILTAYEAMNMNLNNTELVVMSACETGLGEVSNGEGVYGLQRAFKIAGARYLVMSMWNVDDDATQRLMTLFYQNLAAGKEKYYAFRDAQLELMREYPKPFYWGAFKIVGE